MVQYGVAVCAAVRDQSSERARKCFVCVALARVVATPQRQKQEPNVMWIEAVERIGIAGVTVLFVGVALSWIGRRFLGPDGLLTKASDRHLQFIDKTEELMHDSLHLQTKAMDMAAEATADSAECLKSTMKIRKAGIAACEVLEKVSAKMDVDVTLELKAVRRELNGAKGDRHGHR